MVKRLHVAPARRHYIGAAGISSLIIAGALLVGVIGYRFLNQESWIDALVDASMILGGMGQVSPLKTDGAKVFASAYALFSGFFVLASAAILATPWLQLFFHRLDKAIDDE